MAHHHTGSCSHHPVSTSFHTAFAVGITLNISFVLIELFFGYYADSLALVADAVHNLSDVMGLALAWVGYSLSVRAPTARFTFGLGRVSILATVINGLFLMLSAGWILVEAWERFAAPENPMTGTVAIVAGIGIIINLGTALALQRGQHDINIKGAFLHMMVDAAISAAVVVSALLISWTDWAWIDPALSMILALIIVWTTWPLLWQGLKMALDAVPDSVDLQAIKSFIENHDGVSSVPELRIWAISTTKTALSAHIVVTAHSSESIILKELRHDLLAHFGLSSVTLQIEQDHFSCISN
jgi:cobalt-zinc-cadmium efflux system protein